MTTKGKLYIKVKGAKGLPKKDLFGKIDPYAVVQVGGTVHKTQVVKCTYEPNDVPATEVHIEISVWDHDRIGKHDLAGKTMVPLRDLADGLTHTSWYILFADRAQKKKEGEIELEMQWEGAVSSTFTHHQLKLAENIFKKYDTNNNGSLDKEELSHALRELVPNLKHGLFDRYVEMNWQSADSDHSGTVSFTEFALLFEKLWTHNELPIWVGYSGKQ